MIFPDWADFAKRWSPIGERLLPTRLPHFVIIIFLMIILPRFGVRWWHNWLKPVKYQIDMKWIYLFQQLNYKFYTLQIMGYSLNWYIFNWFHQYGHYRHGCLWAGVPKGHKEANIFPFTAPQHGDIFCKHRFISSKTELMW